MVYELLFCLIFCGMRANDYFLSPIIFMCILLNLSLDHVKQFWTCENMNIVHGTFLRMKLFLKFSCRNFRVYFQCFKFLEIEHNYWK